MTRNASTGQFVLGRKSAEKISAVEGIVRSARTGRLLAESDVRGEAGEARRARIRAEFARKEWPMLSITTRSVIPAAPSYEILQA